MKSENAVTSRLILAAGLTFLSTTAAADHFYISGSLGIADQDSTSNKGVFSSGFTTGTVTGVNPPLDISSGSGVSWKTDYDKGNQYALAFGWDTGLIRLELEYLNSDSDIDKHVGVNAAGIDLSGIDAGVLISGNTGDLGVSVADLVADGQGDIETTALMLNAFYDFDLGGNWSPYLGAGVGQIDTDINFSPSGVAVLSDSDDDFGYQLFAGVSYKISESLSVFLNYRYMDGGQVNLDASLLPARFDLDNTRQSLDLGLRFAF
jgi:opacity protein-like surface antigen